MRQCGKAGQNGSLQPRARGQWRAKMWRCCKKTSTCQLSLGGGRKDSVLRKAVAHLFAVDPKLFGASTGTASPNWKAWCSHKKGKNKVKKIKVLIIWSKGLSLFLSRYSSLSVALPPVSPLLVFSPLVAHTPPWLCSYTLSLLLSARCHGD